MPSEWKKRCSKCFFIPQRYIMAIMASLAVVNSYTLRVCLSMAIVEMVNSTKSENSSKSNDQCPVKDAASYHAVKNTDVLYNWDENTQGLILSSFFWGYLITHLPGGIIAEQFGGKHVLGIGVLITAVLTLLTPVVIVATKGSSGVLIALRVIEGLAQGPLYPAVNVLLGQWAPPREKSTMSSLAFAGSQMGTIFSNALSGTLIRATKDWAIVFYFFGSLAVLWYVIWQLICYSSPTTHPFITDKEKEFLERELGGVSTLRKKKIPWKKILTSVPLWALIAVHFGHDWGFFIMVTDLPKYLKSVLKFDVQQSGIWSALPYVFMWLIAVGSGFLCDWLIARKFLSITNARKIFSFTGNMGPAVFMVAASYSGCDRNVAVAMFTIAMGLMGTYFSGMKVNALDLSPNFAGTLMAIVNGLGVFAGMTVPYLVGVMAKNQTIDEWRIIFWVCFGVFAGTILVYLIFASGETQPWNTLEPQADPQNKEES